MRMTSAHMEKGNKMAEQFRTPWLSDVVDILKRDSTNQIMVGNKEFVAVVRCKDRKWSDCDNRCIRNRLYRNSSITLEPESYFRKVEPDDYCSWGERREDAD